MADSIVGKVITDFTPHLCVRFDDGTDIQYRDAKKFMDEGWDVEMLVNWGQIDLNGKIGRKGVRDLVDYAERKGVRCMISSHSNFNWTQQPSVDQYSLSEIEAELDYTDLVNVVGEENFSFGYIEPGGLIKEEVQDNAYRIERVMRDLGYKFAWGLHGTLNTSVGTGMDVDQHYILRNMVPNTDGQFEPWFGSRHWPNCAFSNPFALPGPGTLDLSSTCDVAGTWNGSEWVKDRRSGARPLAYGREADGIIAPGLTMEADFDRTVHGRLEQELGFGGDMCVALHGSSRSAEGAFAEIEGVDLTDYDTAGGYVHLRWLLSYYRAKGFVKPATALEITERACGVPAYGADVVGNPTLRLTTKDFPFMHEMPDEDIEDNERNESVDVMLPVVQGWGSASVAQPTYRTSSFALDNSGTPVAGLSTLDPETGSYDYRDFNKNGNELWWPGEGGTLRPDGEAVNTEVSLGRSPLRPGRYRFEFEVFTAGDLILNTMGVRSFRQYRQTMNSLSSEQNRTTVRKERVESGYNYTQLAVADNTPQTFTYEFYIPPHALPHLPPKVTNGPTTLSLAPGASADILTTSVDGALPGAEVTVLIENADFTASPVAGFRTTDKVMLTGRVSSLGTVVVTATNTGATAVDYGGTTPATSGPILAIMVEDLAFGEELRRGHWEPVEQWMGCFNIAIGANAETQLNNVKLIWLGEN